LAKIGIDAQIVTVDPAKWSALIADKWDGMILSYRGLMPSSVGFVVMNRFLSKDGSVYAKNGIHPDRVEKLLAEARNAPDFESMQQAVQELQKVLIDEYAMFVPMFTLKGFIAMQPNVQNLGMYTTNSFDWNPEAVWIKK